MGAGSNWTTRILAGMLILGGLGVGLLWWSTRPQPPRPSPVAGQPSDAPQTSRAVLSADQARQAVEQQRVGLGNLENDRFELAAETFQQLSRLLPDDPLPARNLAISRLLLLLQAEPDSSAQASDEYLASMQALMRVEPQAASTYWISAKAHLRASEMATDEATRERESAEALHDLERAMQLAPDNPIFAARYYFAGQFHADPAVVDKARAALRRAYELVPDNLFVLTEWLSIQVQTRDATLTQTLEQARRVLAALAVPIERRTRVNVGRMLDQARQAVSEGKWDVVRRSILPLMGPIRSEEVAQSDNRRIDVHPLEFILTDFTPAFYEQYPLLPVTADRVSLQLAVSPIEASAAQWTDVLDVRLLDMDLDDQLDLLVLRMGRLEIYRWPLTGDTPPWCAVEVPLNLTRLLAADLDQDSIPPATTSTAKPAAKSNTPAGKPAHCSQADGDVLVYGTGGMLVLRNELSSEGTSRSLQPVRQDPGLRMDVPVHSAALIDLEHDGDLDVAASTGDGIRLWANRGQLMFEDLSPFSLLPAADQTFDTLALVDWDRDVDLDILLSGAGAAQAGWLENLRHGQFRWRPLERSFTPADSAVSLLPLEADGRPSWDLAAVGEFGILVQFTQSVPAASPQPAQQQRVSTGRFKRLAVADMDNDGMPDLLAWGGDRAQLFTRQPTGDWQAAPDAFSAATASVDFRQPVDLDADGDLDLLAIADQRLTVFVNSQPNSNGSISLRLRGGEDNRSGRVNPWAIGSFVELKVGSLYQAQVATGQSLHFGLGQASRADVIRILWTQGIPQSIIQPPANSVLCEPMMLKGSCPYLYCWTGERFEFFTDLLWAAPLGLQFADGVIAPDRPWEYLKIPGDRLVERQGSYLLQITEELWEAAYFDQVELLAVDHPADVEVFSNEKVGPAEIAEFKIHTVRRRRPPVSARNQRGRDLLPELSQVDGVVAQPFDVTQRQGLAESHFMELDLGPLPSPRQLTLYLTGWIRPTDTSLNVALSHHPELSGPRPPSLWVPDGAGQWREAMPFMGFPGGKTKTIALDLSRIFTGDDYRLRIMTTAELYWDEAFFTVDEEPAEVAVTALPLSSAELHYRGFSAAQPGPRFLPEVYDYDQLDRSPRWPPMRGRFTRYGNVRELLTSVDARQVVMGSGDEMSLRFAAPARPLPAGWRRDFILHNVGWDKDADLNTVYGQTVEPLPFVGMTSYPYSEVTYPDDELRRRYLREYQTRTQSPQLFWRALVP